MIYEDRPQLCSGYYDKFMPIHGQDMVPYIDHTEDYELFDAKRYDRDVRHG